MFVFVQPFPSLQGIKNAAFNVCDGVDLMTYQATG